MRTLSPSSEYNKNKDKCSLVFQTIGIDQTTRCHNPEENNNVIHRSENLTIKYDVSLIEDAFYYVFDLGDAIRTIHESQNWKTSPAVSGGRNTG